jgi:hypothetical protein
MAIRQWSLGPHSAIPLGGATPSDLAVDEKSIYWTNPVSDGYVASTTPVGTVFGNGGTIMRPGACTNGGQVDQKGPAGGAESLHSSRSANKSDFR